MNNKPSITFQQGGLWSRFTSVFAPKKSNGKGIDIDKLAVVELLMYAILILAAIRVIDAALIVNSNMPPIARWGVAIFTLALTEGGFIAWRMFRYHPSANQAQRDTAAIGMLISFVASLTVGISDYLGAALGGAGLTVEGSQLASNEIMVWAFGIAYAIAIIGHVVCALIAREVDDDVAAKTVENVINQASKVSEQNSKAAEQRAEAAAQALVRRAHTVSGTLARLAVAPTAATIAAVTNARRQILEQYGDHISINQVDALLGDILGDLPQFTQQAYTEALHDYLADDNNDLGLDPDKVKDAIIRATNGLEGSLRGALGQNGSHRAAAPRPITQPVPPVSLQVPMVREAEHAIPVSRNNGNGNGYKPNGNGHGGDPNFP